MDRGLFSLRENLRQGANFYILLGLSEFPLVHHLKERCEGWVGV
jgi:hypothetical protein